MRIDEVDTLQLGNIDQLIGLVQWLSGRVKDTAAEKRIGKDTFLQMAHRLGININERNLGDALQQEPLSNLFEPLDPQSQFLVLKGGEQAPAGMPVDQARDVVAQMAKRANPLT